MPIGFILAIGRSSTSATVSSSLSAFAHSLVLHPCTISSLASPLFAVAAAAAAAALAAATLAAASAAIAAAAELAILADVELLASALALAKSDGFLAHEPPVFGLAAALPPNLPPTAALPKTAATAAAPASSPLSSVAGARAGLQLPCVEMALRPASSARLCFMAPLPASGGWFLGAL